MSGAGLPLLCKAGKPRVKRNRLSAEYADDTVALYFVTHIEHLVLKVCLYTCPAGKYNHCKIWEISGFDRCP